MQPSFFYWFLDPKKNGEGFVVILNYLFRALIHSWSSHSLSELSTKTKETGGFFLSYKTTRIGFTLLKSQSGDIVDELLVWTTRCVKTLQVSYQMTYFTKTIIISFRLFHIINIVSFKSPWHQSSRHIYLNQLHILLAKIFSNAQIVDVLVTELFGHNQLLFVEEVLWSPVGFELVNSFISTNLHRITFFSEDKFFKTQVWF